MSTSVEIEHHEAPAEDELVIADASEEEKILVSLLEKAKAGSKMTVEEIMNIEKAGGRMMTKEEVEFWAGSGRVKKQRSKSITRFLPKSCANPISTNLGASFHVTTRQYLWQYL